MYHYEYRQSISSYSQWITADHAHEMPIVIGKFTKKKHLRMIFSFYWNCSVKFLLSFCCCFFVLAWGFCSINKFSFNIKFVTQCRCKRHFGSDILTLSYPLIQMPRCFVRWTFPGTVSWHLVGWRQTREWQCHVSLGKLCQEWVRTKLMYFCVFI